MIVHYKCPSCSNDMVFEPETGDLACPSCKREENIEQYPENLKTTTFSEGEAKEYNCNNCGAVLITTEDTAATHCSFCGAGVVIADRVSGSLAPAMVIPFTITQEQATQAFKKWCQNGLLTKKGFMTKERLKSITGMYVPFWMYDLNSKVEVHAEGTIIRTYSDSEYNYTETKFYDVSRKINLTYLKIPVDASEKMNDTLMDKLEPYLYDELKDFKTPYLAGYIAEKYNYTDDELLPRAKDKISDYIESYISSTTSEYHTVIYKDKEIDTRNVKSYYVLLPVWMITQDYENAEYTFAMNGQTGKVVGKPPLSKFKIAAWFSGITAGTMLVLKTISYAMGGGFW